MKVRNEFQIGLAGLVTLVILFAGIKFLKGTNIFSSNKNYYAIYNNVSGMHESSYVYINGMKAGYVKKISPTDKTNSRFLVEIALDKKLVIPKDSKFVLFSDGLLGGKALRIDPGTSTVALTTSDTVTGISEQGMMDGISSKIDPMMTDLSSVIKRIDTLTAAMNSTLNAQSQENIRQTLNNINSVSKKLDRIALNADNLIEKDRQKLDNIVTNIESITENILTITDSIDSKQIASTLNQVNTSLTNINKVLKKVESGEGNIGQLLNDGQLYYNLTQSTKNLNLLIEDIKNNPKKYINVKVF